MRRRLERRNLFLGERRKRGEKSVVKIHAHACTRGGGEGRRWGSVGGGKRSLRDEKFLLCACTRGSGETEEREDRTQKKAYLYLQRKFFSINSPKILENLEKSQHFR